ncbi:MAG: phenylacetate--CoA ligase family protein [Candidatus Abyssobacteria bacterium SURF_5]|uniref:Phenylacetate--CoA ligase family protein n=1 Tax=Abyssobacteria bacterium (strain SURF_5) TaxID=2093360 RepID=A0A3A4NVJ8_ABYX5|nr:MAG: phenylacetate--CoA ligase family protein [Candidatus Abyssubacteria bacterium SURF_5]
MGARNPKSSLAARDEIEQLQLERLQAVLHRVYKNVPFYKESFRACDFYPDDLTHIDILNRLPMTDRSTLVKNHPYGMFAVPLREVIRLQCTSSVAGEAIVVGFTRNDIDHWTELAARSLSYAGIGPDDVVQMYIGYGLFPSTLGLHYGAERLGATVIPGSHMSPEAAFLTMKNYRASVLVTTPQKALRLVGYVRQNHGGGKALMLRACVLVGQYWSESLRSKVEEVLCSPVFGCYGHSEFYPSAVAAECVKRDGLHIFEDHFIPEIINPATGASVAGGEAGELVITTVTKEAFPLIRYRTGDITRLEYGLCECGSGFVRMDRVSRRTDDMLFIGGISILPSQVEQFIKDAVGGIQDAPVYQLVVEGSETSETLEILIEVNDAFFSDQLRILREIETKIQGELFDALGVSAKVRLVEPGALAEKRKHGRIVDRRDSASRASEGFE